ncbi:hypothetical protein MRS44_000517 [Fusarium solani]|uniref:uncharacterized protein n=1 Tax=Fusarium solani TaxID=169388 RepID=UPI0032C3E2D8|nr:hypothetical protein MRS44_000517 [Fusarium solani]
MASEDKFPLHTAAREGQVSVAEGLLKSDPKLSQRKDDDGRYPIHWAASSNNLDIVQLLANQRSFDADVQDESGWSPLMISASVPESEAVVKLLIAKDADVNLKNAGGQTALHFVASKKNLDIARILIDNSASTRFRDRRGQYPIHRAAAPLNPTDNEGYTPLHHAVAEGHGTQTITQPLLSTPADSSQGDTAVALLKEGADFTIKNSAEELALDLAPDKEVRNYILQGAEREGIELSG